MSNNQRQRHKQKQQRDQVVAKALRNRDETRRKLLSQGRELARRRAENVDRSRERTEDAQRSTNVSAHSTLPSMDSNEEAAARHSHSTVPARPKGSTVPAAVRLYGLGLYEHIQAGTDGQDETPTTERESEMPAADDFSSDCEAVDGGNGR